MAEWMEVNLGGTLDVRIVAGERGICAIDFDLMRPVEGERTENNAMILEAARQLRAYFGRELRDFDLPLEFHGTDFQLRVWHYLETIPYGTTCSYSHIAETIGRPKAVRAVGAANGANPIPIVVPCHRVIGAGGKLVGYGGGLPLKQRLLELEGCTTMKMF